MATAQHDKDKKYIYDKMWTVFDRRSAQVHAAHAVPHLKSDFKVLDVGCGRGSITLDLAKLVPDGYVVGVDINPTLIDAARARAEDIGVKNVEFRVCDANALETFDAESFDVVHEHQVLLYIREPEKVVRSMRRLLKPGGFLSMRDNAWQTWTPGIPEMLKLIRCGEDYMAQLRGGSPPFGLSLHITAHDAGFEWDKIETSTAGWEVFGHETELWAEAAKTSSRGVLLGNGSMTAEEMDQGERAWERWGKMPEARWQACDGAAICWR